MHDIPLQPLRQCVVQCRASERGKMVRMVRNSGGLQISEICGILILQSFFQSLCLRPAASSAHFTS